MDDRITTGNIDLQKIMNENIWWWAILCHLLPRKLMQVLRENFDRIFGHNKTIFFFKFSEAGLEISEFFYHAYSAMYIIGFGPRRDCVNWERSTNQEH